MHRPIGLLLIVANAVSAQATPPQGAAPPAAAQGAAPQRQGPRPFAEVTRGAEHKAGFFDTYEKDDKVWIAVPADRFGKDFLMEMKLAQGIGANGLFGGTMLSLFEAQVMTIERRGDQVFLLQKPSRFTGGKDPAVAQAVSLTFAPSVVESGRIESVRGDSAALIDVTNWFVSDLSGIGQRVRFALATGPGQPPPVPFDRQRSYVESVKSFPRNTNIRARLTFRPGNPTGLASVPDDRFISLAVHYTLAALPDVPMTVRIGDDRVGSILTAHKDFSQDDSTFFVRMVNRWRLERGEQVGNLWRPKQPITYYVDRTVPQRYRASLKAGVEAWNAAFEAAGWKDAIRALDLPADADADDIRYATLRWNTSDQPQYGAIGPSTVDPRTAEILDADILFEASMFANYTGNWRQLASPISASDAFEQALGVGAYEIKSDRYELAGFIDAFAAQGTTLRAALIARGDIGPGDPVPDDFVSQSVKWVVMHEVGHTLGLQHNFRSSASTPNAQLQDRSFSDQNGLYSSVMEYPAINIAATGQPNGYYYTPGVGSYDRWAISYGYTNDANDARRIAREAAERGHLYGTNAESGGAGALDPTINTFDLGEDPLAWGRDRSTLVRNIVANLPKHVLTDNSAPYEVTAAYTSLMNEYARAVAPAVKYIGGAYINRDHAGDPNARPPFVAIPKAKQREALDFVVDRVFARNALAVPPAVLQQMGSNRWFHFGSNTTFNGRIDFPYHEQTLGFQTAVLGQLVQPLRLSMIRDGELRYGSGNMVTIPELFSTVTRAVWSEVWTPGSVANADAVRRDLQRAYLDQMTALIVRPAPRTPADARAVARQTLKDLNRRLTAASQSAALSTYMSAHIDESRARIQKALDAGLEAER
jgi:hypothetical protein